MQVQMFFSTHIWLKLVKQNNLVPEVVDRCPPVLAAEILAPGAATHPTTFQ